MHAKNTKTNESHSGLELPRFASLGRDVTNVRSGPGQKYPIKWVVQKKGLPVEIIREFDNWRRIKDHEGQEGWVYHTLLSGKRTALIIGDGAVDAYEDMPSHKTQKANVSMRLEPMSLVDVSQCIESWCELHVAGISGWIKRKLIWGVYEHENID